MEESLEEYMQGGLLEDFFEKSQEEFMEEALKEFQMKLLKGFVKQWMILNRMTKKSVK